jgi:hypothetical protein
VSDDRRPRAALALVGALVAGAALALLASRPGAEATRDAREFQRLVLGLGFGPGTDLERCGSEFDPRVASPAPGGFERGAAPCGACPRSPLSPPEPPS